MTKYAAGAQILNFQNTFDGSGKDITRLEIQKISSEA